MEISEVLQDFPNVVVLADEVYDFLTFDSHEHVSFATLGDNWHKTITIYSGGKLMNATGWKVGWSIGPANIIYLGGIIYNTSNYCTNTPAQVAFSKALQIVDQGDPSFKQQSV
jgi:aspartate/methionine/tyrosine aminotransferase